VHSEIEYIPLPCCSTGLYLASERETARKRKEKEEDRSLKRQWKGCTELRAYKLGCTMQQ